MTATCDMFALLAFLIAVIVAIVADHPPRFLSWGAMIALGLFLWLLPIALTAAEITHT